MFSFLGHYSVRASNARLAAIIADYNKTTAQVYIDVAQRALYDPSDQDREDALTGQHDSALITLAAVQHTTLPSSEGAGSQGDNSYLVSGDDENLPPILGTGLADQLKFYSFRTNPSMPSPGYNATAIYR